MSGNSNPDFQRPPEGGYQLPANTIIPPGVTGPWIPNTPGVTLPSGVVVPPDAVGPWPQQAETITITPALDRVTTSPSVTYQLQRGIFTRWYLDDNDLFLVHLSGEITWNNGELSGGSGAWLIDLGIPNPITPYNHYQLGQARFLTPYLTNSPTNFRLNAIGFPSGVSNNAFPLWNVTKATNLNHLIPWVDDWSPDEAPPGFLVRLVFEAWLHVENA